MKSKINATYCVTTHHRIKYYGKLSETVTQNIGNWWGKKSKVKKIFCIYLVLLYSVISVKDEFNLKAIIVVNLKVEGQTWLSIELRNQNADFAKKKNTLLFISL
jgi:hypothetical protein